MLDRCRDRRDRERQNGFLRLLFDAGNSLGYVGRFCVYIREIDQVKQEQAVVLRCNDQRIHCALRLRGKKISEKGYGFLLVPIQYMCMRSMKTCSTSSACISTSCRMVFCSWVLTRI